MSLPGSISNLARFKATPSGTSPVGTTGIAATQVAYGSGANQIKGSAQLLFIESSAMQFSTAVTGGIQLYNTSDQTTNYERLETLWSGNQAIIRTVNGGTGTVRAMVIRAGGSGPSLAINPNAGFALVYNSSTGTTNTGFSLSYQNQATSSSIVGFSVLPTYNQASGSAANTDFLINRIETVVGSGAQRFLDMQISGASVVFIDRTGILSKPGGVVPLITTSSAITDQAGAQVGTLTNSPTAGNPAKWVLINDNGTVRKIPTWL